MTTRNHEVKLKMTRDEKEKLQKKADELGIPLSTYIRVCSVHAKVEVK